MWSFARPSETRSNRSSYFNRTRAIFCPRRSAAFFISLPVLLPLSLFLSLFSLSLFLRSLSPCRIVLYFRRSLFHPREGSGPRCGDENSRDIMDAAIPFDGILAARGKRASEAIKPRGVENRVCRGSALSFS